MSITLGVVLVPKTEHPPQQPTRVANPYEQQRMTGLRHLLDRWATALRADDRAALSRIVDPHAAAGFLEAQQRKAANLHDLPFADFGFDIGDEPEVPVAPETADVLGAADVWSPSVYLRYAIVGPDVAPTRKPVALTIARRGDEWILVSDTPVGNRVTWRAPWDCGPVIAVRVRGVAGATSVVLGHPDHRAEIEALAAELPAAVAAVDELWGAPNWPRSVLVVATDSADEFTSMVGTQHNGADIAAVAVSDAVPRGARSGAVPSGQRIVFSPDAATRLTDASRRSILRHELIHVATRAATVDGSPLWMLEGYADYSGYRGSGLSFRRVAPILADRLDGGASVLSLPSDIDFAAPGERSTAAYELGWSACAFVAAEFGEPRLTTLYRRVAGGPLDQAGQDAVLRAVLGIGRDEFIARWSRWAIAQT